MKLRIKNTNYWGEVIGNAGSAENPSTELLMKNGDIISVKNSELTSLSLKKSAEKYMSEFMLSVFSKNKNIKNQIVFFIAAIILSFIFGALFL